MTQTLPIAETFHSWHGEGQWVNTPMHFVRLAGCTVGKRWRVGIEANAGIPFPSIPVLPSGREAWQCHTYDGRAFWCDTDFSKKQELTVAQLLDATWEKHVCLTGGEPLMHTKKLNDQEFWFSFCSLAGKMVHIETSGTIPLPEVGGFLSNREKIWVTVSPKEGVIDEVITMANEVRLLVDQEFNPKTLNPRIVGHPNVFLCPVNFVEGVDRTHLKLVEYWLKQFPHWRASVQVHKLLGMR